MFWIIKILWRFFNDCPDAGGKKMASLIVCTPKNLKGTPS